MIAAAADADVECGCAAAASSAISKVDALLALLLQCRESMGDSSAAAQAADHAVKSLAVLKSQCSDLLGASVVVDVEKRPIPQQALQLPREPPSAPAISALPLPRPSLPDSFSRRGEGVPDKALKPINEPQFQP